MPTTIQRGLRTLVASAVGFVVAFLAVHFGFKVDEGTQASLIAGITAAATAGYNALALWLEKRYSWAKWLLLGIGAPSK